MEFGYGDAEQNRGSIAPAPRSRAHRVISEKLQCPGRQTETDLLGYALRHLIAPCYLLILFQKISPVVQGESGNLFQTAAVLHLCICTAPNDVTRMLIFDRQAGASLNGVLCIVEPSNNIADTV